MKKLFLLFLLLVVISSCTYNENIQSSSKSPKEIVVDVSKFQDKPLEGGEKSRNGVDYGYPVNMPTYLNWGEAIGGMDQFHSQSFVSPTQQQGNFGTCWVFGAVALVESHYLLTHNIGTPNIDIAELGVLFGCNESECYWSSNHPCNGGSVRDVLDWMKNNPVPLESYDCFPYSDLINDNTGNSGYNGCSCFYCDLHYGNQADNPDSDPYSNCQYINLNYIRPAQIYNPTFEKIQELLWQYGPIVGSFKGYAAGGTHVMLIYGYDTRSGNKLIVKDTSIHNDQYKTFSISHSPYYVDYLKPDNPSNLCANQDYDGYAWWGIESTALGSPISVFCETSYPEPDCFDGNGDVSQCRFSCNDDGEYNWNTETDIYDEPWGGPGTTCDPWESCNTCFDDCYIPPTGRSTDACAGDGICEGGEDCITSPYDCAPCSECSDRIDNDGDGLIDFQGYRLDGEDKDPGCTDYFDTSESPRQCAGGTEYETCSDSKPWYCTEEGESIEDCNECGCPVGKTCQLDGTCDNKCIDGTPYGSCKSNGPPLYCNNGELISNCHDCPCPEGKDCHSDGSCYKYIPEEDMPEIGLFKTSPKPSFWQKLFDFFR